MGGAGRTIPTTRTARRTDHEPLMRILVTLMVLALAVVLVYLAGASSLVGSLVLPKDPSITWAFALDARLK